MYWSDRIAQEIVASGKYLSYWVDDMKTPSGRIHIGSLRGVVIHDLIYKSLIDAKVKVDFTYVFDDHDPMDEVSASLNKEEWSKFLGQPLFSVPSPDTAAGNYADFFANEFVEVFNKIACQPRIIKSSELYFSGKMNDGVKACLDNADKIRKIYEELYHKKIADNWFPFQVVCPKCGKVATTKVTNWDGDNVTFSCSDGIAKYTTGCGCTGKISPYSSKNNFAGKLPWKIEWAVKWQVIGITVEGAGKDHMSDGGSHDVASRVCERVLKYPVPFPVPYEWFLLGGKKMSTSKGVGTSAKEISEIIPPYLLRFLFVRTDYHKSIDFDPINTMVIPDLFDEYDRCWQAYNDDSDPLWSRIFELSQVGELPKRQQDISIPRFRDIANFVQQDIDIVEKYTELKGRSLTTQEEKIITERKNYAFLWLEKYAPTENQLGFSKSLPKEAETLSTNQKKYLKNTIPLIEKKLSVDELNMALYNLAKESSLKTQDAFAAIYLAFIGKNHGPKAAWFLLQYPQKDVINRLREASMNG